MAGERPALLFYGQLQAISILPRSSLRIFPATAAVRPETSQLGLYSTMSAPTTVAVIERFAHGHASRFAMGDAGSEGGVEDVDVEGDVDRAPGLDFFEGALAADLEDLDAKTSGLLFLLRVHGTDADLNEAFGQFFFHDAGEGGGVGAGIALEVGVEVGVSVEVDDGEVFEDSCEGADDGVGDGVISAEADGAAALFQERGDGLFDGGEGVAVGPTDLSAVGESALG